ncbi:MAG: ACT domain-containing protein [Ruminococcaceae bacterium]|nr:ACT domain-containing protein [Oscillospiraceae bacterium]
MTIKQLSIFVENKAGTVAQITQSIADAGVSIRALSVADTQEFGILRLIVNDVEKAKEALSKNDCVVSITKVIGVEIPDVAGGLSEVLQLMSQNNINVEYLYAFITISGKHAYVVLRVEDNEKAAKILTENGVKLVTQENIDNL